MKELSKKTKITAVVSALLCVIIIAGVIIMFFNNSKGDKPVSIIEITSFESLNLRFSGMRVTEEYEIISKGETSEISYYHIKYGGEEERELQESAVCDTQDVIDILNECKVGKWNGFHGKHPKGVLDGRMFTLTAVVNQNEKIRAEGSENFPKNFNKFEEWMRNKLF